MIVTQAPRTHPLPPIADSVTCPRIPHGKRHAAVQSRMSPLRGSGLGRAARASRHAHHVRQARYHRRSTPDRPISESHPGHSDRRRRTAGGPPNGRSLATSHTEGAREWAYKPDSVTVPVGTEPRVIISLELELPRASSDLPGDCRPGQPGSSA